MRVSANSIRCFVVMWILLVSSNLLSAEIVTKELNDSMVELETFYKAPSFEKFIATLNVLVPYYTAQDSSVKLNTFTLVVLNKHKDYVQKILQERQTYPEPTQLFLQNIFRLTEGGDRKQLARAVSKLQNLQIIKAPSESLDKLWAAFFATGDKRAIRRILRFINRDKSALLFAHQYMTFSQLCHAGESQACEALQSLNQLVQLKYSAKAATAFHQISAVNLAIWSIENQSAKDPTAKDTVSKIFRQEPTILNKSSNKYLSSIKY